MRGRKEKGKKSEKAFCSPVCIYICVCAYTRERVCVGWAMNKKGEWNRRKKVRETRMGWIRGEIERERETKLRDDMRREGICGGTHGKSTKAYVGLTVWKIQTICRFVLLIIRQTKVLMFAYLYWCLDVVLVNL